MTETHWLILTAALSGLVGRVTKMYPKVPKGLLPWIVLVVGWAIMFGRGLYNGAEPGTAALEAWTGLAMGVVAVGGHEALKPALSMAIGEERANRVLGHLPSEGEK